MIPPLFFQATDGPFGIARADLFSRFGYESDVRGASGQR